MKKFLTQIGWLLEYCAVLLFSGLVRILPHGALRFLADLAGAVLYFVPSVRKLLTANIRCAMPELPEKEIRRIARASMFHLFMNLLEFIWLHGDGKRIERCYDIGEDIGAKLREHVAAGERIIFVNPHLGSWEASGIMAPYYSNVDLVAIAKPVRNPYLNRLLNEDGREKNKGLRIIFSRGAIRAAVRALREGSGIGTLIDQNTRVRDGGAFVDFFGIPVSSSKAPASLKRFCDANRIPAVVIYGSSVREADGKIHAKMAYLPKPFAEYPDDTAVLQELMRISEQFIRRYPEQYLWFYHRFQYIPPDAPEEVRKRYPYYAAVPKPSFFDARAKHAEKGASS